MKRDRIVHTKGFVVSGNFKLKHNMEMFTKANLFRNKNDITKIKLRFSSAASTYIPDVVREVRGFAIRFYSKEGNYDIVGNNTPIFFLNDPKKFKDFVKSQEHDLSSEKTDRFWSFFAKNPETVHQILYFFSEYGIPKSYDNMNGFGVHTFKWINDNNQIFWVKYHFISNQGLLNFNDKEIRLVDDLDWYKHNFIKHLKDLGKLSWTLKVQIIPFEDQFKYSVDIFDPTKIVSENDYPLMDVGVVSVDRILNDLDSSELALSPTNFIPGISSSPDKILSMRLPVYEVEQKKRLGASFKNINTHNNDVSNIKLEKEHYFEDDFYNQAALFYKGLLSDQKIELIKAISNSLSHVEDSEIIKQQLRIFEMVDKSMARRIKIEIV